MHFLKNRLEKNVRSVNKFAEHKFKKGCVVLFKVPIWNLVMLQS